MRVSERESSESSAVQVWMELHHTHKEDFHTKAISSAHHLLMAISTIIEGDFFIISFAFAFYFSLGFSLSACSIVFCCCFLNVSVFFSSFVSMKCMLSRANLLSSLCVSLSHNKKFRRKKNTYTFKHMLASECKLKHTHTLAHTFS